MTDEWYTPQWLFDLLDEEFHFDLDPCSTHENAKTILHFTMEDNGLEKNWGGPRVFCNPPYGRGIGKWVQKGFQEAQNGAVVVMLLPASTDTKWFHDYCLKGEIRFVRGRLRFGGSSVNAPFASMVVIFGKENK